MFKFIKSQFQNIYCNNIPFDYPFHLVNTVKILHEDKEIAFINYFKSPHKNSCRLGHLHVNEEYQRQKLGTRLVNIAIADIIETNPTIEKITLSSHEEHKFWTHYKEFKYTENEFEIKREDAINFLLSQKK